MIDRDTMLKHVERAESAYTTDRKWIDDVMPLCRHVRVLLAEVAQLREALQSVQEWRLARTSPADMRKAFKAMCARVNMALANRHEYVFIQAKKGGSMNPEQFDVMAKEIKLQVKANHRLRAALLPFAAAAGTRRLTDCMTDQPLPDDAVLALGVKVSAWKKAIELTGADDPPDCSFWSPEDPRWGKP